MHSINNIRLHNINTINEVVDSNKTSKRGNRESSPELEILGAAISAINRKKIRDPKKKKREIEKIRNNILNK